VDGPWHLGVAAQELDGAGAALAGAHAHNCLDGHDPDLPVADLAGLRGLGDGGDQFLNVVVVDDSLDLDLRRSPPDRPASLGRSAGGAAFSCR
jgi:hypothetical protein